MLYRNALAILARTGMCELLFRRFYNNEENNNSIFKYSPFVLFSNANLDNGKSCGNKGIVFFEIFLGV